MHGFLDPLISGISEGMILVLAASGLSLVFGVMRVVNMAHGGFIMLGAFLFYAFTTLYGLGYGAFIAAMVSAVLATGAAGAISELTVFRRFYHLDPLSGLLGTFALMLLFEGLVSEVWGINPLAVRIPRNLESGSIHIGGSGIPIYNLIPIGAGIVAILAITVWLQKTRNGLATRAVGRDRYMADLLGINSRTVFTTTFTIGCGLAGLAGALLAPQISLDQTLGATYVLLAFSVVLVGGVGSLTGTLIAGLGLGILDSFLAYYSPSWAGYSIYLAMIIILLLRPNGLLGARGSVALG